MKLARLACVCALFSGVIAQARPLSPKEKTDDFEQLASMIKSQYGPYDLKRLRFSIDVDAMARDYAKKAETVSNLEFYHLINRFVAEFHDSHFRSAVDTNHISTLGFVADRVAGVVLIDKILPLLPASRFPFERGDEIVEMDGKPVADIVDELSEYLGMGNPESSLRYASVMVGLRPTSLVPPPKMLFSKVTVRHGTSTITETVTLPWFSVGELPDDQPTGGTATAETWSVIPPDYDRLAIDEVFEGLPKTEESFRCQGTTRTAVPKGATVLMTEPFVAYYHSTPEGNVGYLRIPHYSWGEKSAMRFKQYEWAVDQMERNTVGLIIDQDHNCGGSVTFLESMVSLFADKPYKGLEFQFLASRSEYLQFKSWMESEGSHTLEGSDWLGVVDIVKKAWQSRSRLSAKTTFRNGRMLSPNPLRYTKPVLMLVDEMSGSGGDAFPAMMQGMGRAKLMGMRTMGAGGHVAPMPVLNYSANRINMTKSLFFRPDGTPVEGNGVEPDIKYQPTRDDFLYKYRNYQKRYLEELAKIL